MAQGKATITIAGKESTEIKTTSTVTVNAAELKIGDYLEYYVSDTDICSDDVDESTDGVQGFEFDSRNGWRVLDAGTKNSDGTYSNVKLISTGIPADCSFHGEYDPTDSSNNSSEWWGTLSQVKLEYGLYDTAWNKDISNYFVAYGLKYNFGQIPCSNSYIGDNSATYEKVRNKTGTAVFNDLFFVNNYAAEVHNLTLEELNKCLGRDESSTDSINADIDIENLFYLRGLNKYGFSDSTDSYSYWLANPIDSGLGFVSDDGLITRYTDLGTNNVRPVVTLWKTVTLQMDEEGVWTIIGAYDGNGNEWVEAII